MFLPIFLVIYIIKLLLLALEPLFVSRNLSETKSLYVGKAIPNSIAEILENFIRLFESKIIIDTVLFEL